MNDEDVEFIDEDNQGASRSFRKAFYSPSIKWLVKKGIVGNEAEANTFLITIIVIIFSLSALFTYIGFQYTRVDDSKVIPSPSNGYTVSPR